MTDNSGSCGTGNYSCPCCCASVTGMRAGIHPDFIESESRDIYISDAGNYTFQVEAITYEPVHIVDVSVGLACVKRNDGTSAAAMRKQIESTDNAGQYREDTVTPAMFSLFTSSGWDQAVSQIIGGWNPHDTDESDRVYIATGAVSSAMPYWQSGPDLFGRFCDRGLFVEMNAPSDQYGLRVTVNYVRRVNFSPAYGDPSQVLQHYWNCAHIEDGEEFLGGYYGGTSSDADGEEDDDGGGSDGGFNASGLRDGTVVPSGDSITQ